MIKPMRDAFAARSNRFHLLDEGVARCCWNQGQYLLEVGCSTGEAAAHLASLVGLNIVGIDFDKMVISEAAKANQNRCCKFLYADARSMPFENSSFDGMYCEAAFAPMDDKELSVKEYFRVLKPGALLLLNDFTIRTEMEDNERSEVRDIPCFKGVQTMKSYCELFHSCGFQLVYQKEDYTEFLRIVLRMSQIYGVEPANIGPYLVGKFCAEDKAICSENFFKKARMSYCQMIFQKMQRREGN